MDIDERGESNFLILLGFLDEVTELTAQMLEHRSEYEESDHVAFLSLCFGMKQLEHAKSLRTMAQFRHDRDAGLIARTMLEGMAILLWASHHKTRAFNWRAYSLVSDYKSAEDGKVDIKLNNLLDKHAQIFKTKKSVNLETNGEKIPIDPFGKNWMIDENGRHMKRSDLFDYLKGMDLYDVYSTLSQWEHWTPKGIGQCLLKREGSVIYVEGSPSAVAMSLAVGFQAMYHTLEVLCSHSGSCISKIEDLKTRYIDAVAT